MRQTQQAHKERRQVEGRDNGRRVRLAAKPHRELGYWAVPMPTIDPQVVARSARALERYGPDFTYGHYAGVKRLPIAVGGVAGVRVAVRRGAGASGPQGTDGRAWVPATGRPTRSAPRAGSRCASSARAAASAS